MYAVSRILKGSASAHRMWRWSSCLALALGGLGCAVKNGNVPRQTWPPVHDVEAAIQANDQGLNFVNAGQFDRAEGEFRRALGANPGSAAAHNNLGLVLQRNGRLHEAAVEFTAATKLNPTAIEPRMNLGRLYESVGWWEAAEKEYRDVLRLDQNHAEANERLARVLAKSSSRSGLEPPSRGTWGRIAESP